MDHGYPTPRDRPAGHAAALSDKFPRRESTRGFVTLGNTDADIINFSGTPDRVEVFVETNDAILRFTGLIDTERAEITIRAGVRYEPDFCARRVIGRNATAGLNASVQVIGKWAEPREGVGNYTSRPEPAPSTP